MKAQERVDKIIKNEIPNLAIAAAVVLAASTLLGMLDFWRFPNFHQWFQVLAAAVLVVGALYRRASIVAVAALVVAANAAIMAPYANVAPEPAKECDKPITTLSINALGDYSDHDALLQQIRTEDPDVLYVCELSSSLYLRLAEMYEHHQTGNFGHAALFSRMPIVDSEVVDSIADRPPVNVVLRTPEGPLLRVIGAHVLMPADDERAKIRDIDLNTIASAVSESEEPTILMGDLNITMFEPGYAPLESAGLANARAGRGVNPTWPSFWPLRIPIDHVMHTADMQTCDVHVGDDFGSDHLPLAATLAFHRDEMVGEYALMSQNSERAAQSI